MSSGSQIAFEPQFLPLDGGQEAAEWYAIHTYPRHEKRVAADLERRQIETYLPLVAEEHQWSDRRKTVDLPLFSCYVFARIRPTAAERVKVLQAPGVIGFVGSQRQGTPIAEQEIEVVRQLLKSEVKFKTHPFLKVGQRVRVRGGALDGMEGLLVRRSGEQRLVVSVATIERSLSISVEGYQVESA